MSEYCKIAELPALPMFVSNWIFGMGIIEYPLGKQHRRVSFFYTAMCVTIYLSLAAYAYPYVVSMTQEYEINRKVMTIIFYTHTFLTIVTVVMGWRRSKGMHSIVEQMAIADLSLENIGIPKKYNKIFRIQLGKFIGSFIFIIIIVTMNTLTTFSDYYLQTGQVIAVIVMNYPIIIMFIVDATFINIVEYIYHKFKKINIALGDMLTSTQDTPQHARLVNDHFNQDESSQGKTCSAINRDSKKVHLELVKLCREVDDTFGAHILLSVIVSLAIITGSLYHIYVLVLYTKISRYGFNKVFMSTCTWFIYYILKIYAFSCCCSAVSEESTLTGDIISEFYDEPHSNQETRMEIRDFHIQMIRNAITFKAYGFITLDFTLIQGIIGAVTTYLMILAQFGNFISPNCTNLTCT